MRKIAFIVQRYGTEVNGGAEYLCRLFAERLTAQYTVDVLTSCALEYVEWANHYPAGTTELNGVTVLRFPTGHTRQHEELDVMTQKLFRRAKQQPSPWVAPFETVGRLLTGRTNHRFGQLWARYQGPYVPGLIQYLTENHGQYDALIFVTYLYYPTIAGLAIAPHKSIFIPTAHDELPIYVPLFRRLFRLPKAILYLTTGEKRFVNATFHNEAIYSDMIGVGIDVAPATAVDLAIDLPNIDAPYLIYIGRIDPAKCCDELFDYFIRFKENNPSSLKLVLVGQAFMPIPEHPDVMPVGFVDEAVKVALLKAAKALVISSIYESLSMVTLESFAYGIPVIANQNGEVIRDHIDISQAGVLYGDYDGFERAVQQVLTQDSAEMARNGRAYIAQNYTWGTVLAKINKAIAYVGGRGGPTFR